MAERGVARLFRNGRSQAVRLPREFRLPGDRVHIRRVGRAVVLEPLYVDVNEWFDEMDRLGEVSRLPEERAQPPTPARDVDLG